MPAIAPITDFDCPQCAARLQPTGLDAHVRCPACNWAGRAFLFSRIVMEADRTEAALPEDASCVHHPGKRAVAVCAGTGDFICALCSIEMDGRTYSAQYLETGGKAKVAQSFNRYLDRPDREAVQLGILSIFVFPAYPLFLALGIFKLVRVFRLRRADRLFDQTVRPLHLAAAVVLFAVMPLVCLFAILATALKLF